MSARRAAPGPRMRRVDDEHGPAPAGAGEDDGRRALDALGLTDDERLVLARVADILRRINYGTVVLVVQDGKVVQIEMAEKFRLR